MLTVRVVTQFKKDIKKFQHNKIILKELNSVLQTLISEKALGEKFRDHNLSGEWNTSRECHIRPDILLIYRVDKKSKELILERIGSHSELFD